MQRPFATARFYAALGVLMTIALTSTSFAQSQTPPSTIPNLYLVRVTHVKPEMLQEYNAFMQNETIPAYKKAGVKQLNTLTTSLFGEDWEFVTIEPAASLALFDGPSPLNRALGAEGQQAHNAKRRRLVSRANSRLVQLLPSLCANIPQADAPPAKGAFAVTITVAPGRSADYENVLKNDLLPVLQKAFPHGVLTSKVLLGGGTNEYHVWMLVDSFGELEHGLITAVADGFAKAGQKTAGIVQHSETATYRYLPELSIRPEARKAENK